MYTYLHVYSRPLMYYICVRWGGGGGGGGREEIFGGIGSHVAAERLHTCGNMRTCVHSFILP